MSAPEVQERKLLIVSDMHLGRDCNYITGFGRAARPDTDFDQAFVDMIDHYTSGQEGQWRLIVAGDFVDFVEVVVVPQAQGPLRLHLSFEVNAEERHFGLGTEAERSLVKLEATFDYHAPLFARLARFLREGGELVVLRGNHDAEFHWKKVQRVFRRRMADLAFKGQHLDVDDAIEKRNDFQTRVHFVPWMYYEKERIYIEHGHQYDPYCSFDHQLYPVSPTNPKRIDTPVFMFAMRYFVNMLNDFAAHNADLWTVKDYLQWLRAKGPAGLLYTGRMALEAGVRMLIYAGRFALGRVRRYNQEHAKSLQGEAERYGLPVSKVERIDALHYVPVNRNLPELMRLLFLDRLLLVAGAFALAMFVLLIFESVWIELAGIGLVAGAAFWINKRMAPRRFLLPGPKQAQAARRISKLLKVPLVVMGHSHVRRISDLAGGAKYVNTGCWLPPLDGKPHTDPQAPCTCKLSHLVVEDKKADLRVFCRAAKTVRLADVEETKAHHGGGTPEAVNTADLLVP